MTLNQDTKVPRRRATAVSAALVFAVLAGAQTAAALEPAPRLSDAPFKAAIVKMDAGTANLIDLTEPKRPDTADPQTTRISTRHEGATQ